MPMLPRNQWPTVAAHRQLRRQVVRLWRPGRGIGTGMLVGPDLVLTCAHVVDYLFGNAGLGAAEEAGEVEVMIGLDEAPRWRGLALSPRRGTTEVRPWIAAMGERAGNGGYDYDFALLRLDQDVEDLRSEVKEPVGWLSLKALTSLPGLVQAQGQRPVELFLYHYPSPESGDPNVDPMMSPDNYLSAPGHNLRYLFSDLETAPGSSGGVVFARVAGGADPFPLALHKGRDGGRAVAVPLTHVRDAVRATNPAVYDLLTDTPEQIRLQRRIDALAEPQIRLAQVLLDREGPARNAVLGRDGNGKCVQPIFATSSEERKCFQERLARFDLPLRRLNDDQRIFEMRAWTLAGMRSAPPVAEGFPLWGTLNLGGGDWLKFGGVSAIQSIRNGVADSRGNESSVLMTAQVVVRAASDYDALDKLLEVLEGEFRGEAGFGEFLVLLWVDDTAPAISETVRAKRREALRRLWLGAERVGLLGRLFGKQARGILGPVVGIPIELGDLGQDDLDDWEQVVSRAFDVTPADVENAVEGVWARLSNSTSPAMDYGFASVLGALDERLRDWVRKHFRRVHETGGTED